MARPRVFYRGDRRSKWGLTLVVVLAVALVLLLLFLFYYLQGFLVYEKDGLRLVLPGDADAEMSRGGEAAVRRQLALLQDVEIVVDKTDYSGVQTAAGEDVPAVRARYIPAVGVTGSALDVYIGSMGDFNALALELKPAAGVLTYASRVPLTNSYGVNGSLDLKPYVDKLKERGVYLIGVISCLEDTTLAVRNSAIALKDASTGSIYTSEGKAWLDPYSDATRAYLSALIDEMADMGFDEVLLSGLWCPNSASLQFSANMTVTPDTESAVSSLSLYLRERAEADGIRLSAVAESSTLRAGGAGMFGQDLPVFFRVFDRVAFEAEQGSYELDYSTLSAVLSTPADNRILPICSGFTPDKQSYAQRT
ncbi:MAG: hypothetical protein IJ705_00810 [Oscillospiraceae bacterium]|nr:hypothetical protein [Oscillospiraceae bacterium]